jgi:hypothetical protein
MPSDEKSVGGVGMTGRCEPTKPHSQGKGGNPSCGEVIPAYVAIGGCRRRLIKVCISMFDSTSYGTIPCESPYYNGFGRHFRTAFSQTHERSVQSHFMAHDATPLHILGVPSHMTWNNNSFFQILRWWNQPIWCIHHFDTMGCDER